MCDLCFVYSLLSAANGVYIFVLAPISIVFSSSPPFCSLLIDWLLRRNYIRSLRSCYTVGSIIYSLSLDYHKSQQRNVLHCICLLLVSVYMLNWLLCICTESGMCINPLTYLTPSLHITVFFVYFSLCLPFELIVYIG